VIIGVMKLDIKINDSFSLKDKRKVIKGIIDSVKKRFNISIAEVGSNELLDFSELGMAIVVKDNNGFIDSVFDKVINFIETNFYVDIVDVKRGFL
jgi:hypothetical protein